MHNCIASLLIHCPFKQGIQWSQHVGHITQYVPLGPSSNNFGNNNILAKPIFSKGDLHTGYSRKDWQIDFFQVFLTNSLAT